MDQRGHGRGIRSRRPFGLEECADDVAALIGAEQLDRVVVVGYSMGGAVAQLVARRHGGLLDGLVLSATAARFSSTRLGQLSTGPVGAGLSLLAAGIPHQLRQVGLSRFIDRRSAGGGVAPWAVEEWKASDPVAIMQAGIALASFDSTPWLAELDLPAAVVVTTGDTVVPPRFQRRLAESIPGASVFEVAGDHRACVEQADAFVPALAAACRSVTRAGATRP